MTKTILRFQVETASGRVRLDDYLFAHIPELSRMYIRELVKELKCDVNGQIENIGYRLRPNDFVEIEADLSRGTAMRPEEIPLDVVFEDAEIIVVNKPAGMLVHPTHRNKSGTLLNALTFYLNHVYVNGNTSSSDVDSTFLRPGLIHRLDKQTSGLIVVAKTVKAHRILAEQFKRKQVAKKYLALVEGVVFENEGLIEEPIGRYAELKHWNIKPDGKYAETRYWVCERYADATLLELEPVTGRTNQLRIHCASIGHPIIGDMKRSGREFERLCLHAYKLKFKHPDSDETLEFERYLKFSGY